MLWPPERDSYSLAVASTAFHVIYAPAINQVKLTMKVEVDPHFSIVDSSFSSSSSTLSFVANGYKKENSSRPHR